MKSAKIFDNWRKGKGGRGRSWPPTQYKTKRLTPLLSLSMCCRIKEHCTFNSKRGNFNPRETVLDKQLPVTVWGKNFRNRICITELYKLLVRFGMRYASFVDDHLAPIYAETWIGIKYLCSVCILAFCAPGKWPHLWDNIMSYRHTVQVVYQYITHIIVVFLSLKSHYPATYIILFNFGFIS